MASEDNGAHQRVPGAMGAQTLPSGAVDERIDEHGPSGPGEPKPRSPWTSWSLVTMLAVPLAALTIAIGAVAALRDPAGGDSSSYDTPPSTRPADGGGKGGGAAGGPGGGAAKDIAVPQIEPTDQQGYAAVLAKAGLVPGKPERRISDAPRGTVIGTDPAVGTKVAKGATVTMLVSAGG